MQYRYGNISKKKKIHINYILIVNTHSFKSLFRGFGKIVSIIEERQSGDINFKQYIKQEGL